VNKICITNQNHRSGLAVTAGSGARQVSFLEVWGDAPASTAQNRSLDALLLQSNAYSSPEAETRPGGRFKSLLANLCALLG